MDFKLTAEQREMVDTVRKLAQVKFKPRVRKWQDGTFPFENIKDLAGIGVLGMAVPEEYGGLGLPVLDCVLVLEEIAKVCYSTSMAVMSAMGAQNRIISVFAPEHVKRKFLPATPSSASA
jgi:alkylation response protein AidB-like acyl-CoA dehydrogenase